MPTVRLAMIVGPCVLAGALIAAPAGAAEAEGRDIGDRLELFVDAHAIESMSGVRLVLHPPEPREVALRTDAPWEGSGSAYFTVLADGETFRMYYRGLAGDGRGEEVTCLAESNDGISWTKPNLGLFEHQGSTENNIVWKGPPGGVTHNFTPFVDTRPGVPEDQRYKALAGGPLYAFVSADGLRWRLLSESPVLTNGAFDSQNLAFWDANRGLYVSYYRIFTEGVRAIATATSEDFVTWSDPLPIDLGDTPPEHFYTNATIPYFRGPHYYFSFPKRFQPGRKKLADYHESGISEGVFLSSRDGLRFDRTFMEAFIRPGLDRHNWGDRSSMTAWGILQTGPEEMSIYYSQNYNFPTHHIRRGVLRLDGIASVQAGYEGGELLTKPIRFAGGRLVLNYSTSASGSVRVEIQDAGGKPHTGFALTDGAELYGDSVAEEYPWSSGAALSALVGQPIRLRFVLKDADLYSYRFAE